MTPDSSLFILPPDYPRIRLVHSFDELLSTPFGDGVNALCWPRKLAGDYEEVAAHLVRTGTETLDDGILRALPLSAGGRIAVGQMIEDRRLLREAGLDPLLDCIKSYDRDEEPGPVPTDVYSFHADSAPVEAETWLCSYNESCSEGLRNDEARRRIDIQETRAELLQLFGGEDDESFAEYLTENCFDLHYAPHPHAKPFSFGMGNLWRIACDYPGSPVPPCIHRAPATIPGRPPRLLLIS